MNQTLSPLEQTLVRDARAFDQFAPPQQFRAELGRTLRHAPPPAAPPTDRFRWVPFRNAAIATAAGIAILIGLSSIEAPHDPQGLATAIASANETVSALPETATQFADSTYENEWDNLKADAVTFSGPFKSAFPTSLIRLD